MWRKEMRHIVDAMKTHLNFKHDAQVADAVGLSRQHIHMAVKENRLVPDKFLQFCLSADIDISRLLKDGKAVLVSSIDQSDSNVNVSHYREGGITPFSKRSMPKWMADLSLRRDVDLNETIAMLTVETDEMEPKIKKDSIVYLDTIAKTPQGGYSYLNMNGYGIIRRLTKATGGKDLWHLRAEAEEGAYGEPLEFDRDFSIIGRVQFISHRI